MTAVPDWDIVGARYTDAELVRASLAGDRAAFAQMYDRYADRLYDFCVWMLRDRDGAADCVQDAFCVAATRLSQLREPDKLRPWLYSIARHEALRALSERRRESPSDAVPDEMSDEPGPETLAARTELADLISEAAGGLSDRDRTVLELSYRHGLDAPELAEALGVSHTNANTMLVRLRDTVERSLGALLVARRVRNNPEECSELAAMLHGWDGHFTVLMRKRVARHIESCPNCDAKRHRMVSPTALLGGTPALIPAPEGLRELTLDKVRLAPSTSPIAEGTTGAHPSGSDDASGERSRGSMLPVVLFVAALLGTLGVLSAWLYQQNTTSITPANITGTTPAPPTGAGTGMSSPSETASAPSTPVTTTFTAAPLPPAQTTMTTEPSARPEPPPPATVDEPTAVLEPTIQPMPADPSTPPSSNRPRSGPRLPSTTHRPTGIAGIPQTAAPSSPKRRAVNPPPNRSRAPSPSR
jgi:RNA polymerase sigma factor (sigma-70 family)